MSRGWAIQLRSLMTEACIEKCQKSNLTRGSKMQDPDENRDVSDRG